jgi:hypothetical protein
MFGSALNAWCAGQLVYKYGAVSATAGRASPRLVTLLRSPRIVAPPRDAAKTTASERRADIGVDGPTRTPPHQNENTGAHQRDAGILTLVTASPGIGTAGFEPATP